MDIDSSTSATPRALMAFKEASALAHCARMSVLQAHSIRTTKVFLKISYSPGAGDVFGFYNRAGEPIAHLEQDSEVFFRNSSQETADSVVKWNQYCRLYWKVADPPTRLRAIGFKMHGDGDDSVELKNVRSCSEWDFHAFSEGMSLVVFWVE